MKLAMITLAAFALLTGSEAAQVAYASDGKITQQRMEADLSAGKEKSRPMMRREVKRDDNSIDLVEVVEGQRQEATSNLFQGQTPGNCQNNNTVTDAKGRTCDRYVVSGGAGPGNVYMCGHYDTDDFSAFFHCCACQCVSGDVGRMVDNHGHGCDWYMGEYAMLMGTHDTPPMSFPDESTWPNGVASVNGSAATEATAANSVFGGGNYSSNGGLHNRSNMQTYQPIDGNNESATYGAGDQLLLVQGGGPSQCGLHDNEGFSASTMCCACGGGISARSWEGEWTPAPPTILKNDLSKATGHGFYHDGSGGTTVETTPPPVPAPAAPVVTG